MEHPPKIDPIKPGIEVIIGGVTYVAPKLNLRGVQTVQDALSVPPIDPAIPNYALAEARRNMDIAIALLAASLSRNYASITADSLRDEIEGDELAAITEAVPKIFELSGLKPKENASGEVIPASASG
jgi:hypothetical protein